MSGGFRPIGYSTSSPELALPSPGSGSSSGPPLEGLYPLPNHWSRYSRPVELRKMIRRVVVDASYHVWSKITFRKLAGRPMLVVEAAAVN